jgi:hypothetical protein
MIYCILGFIISYERMLQVILAKNRAMVPLQPFRGYQADLIERGRVAPLLSILTISNPSFS